MDEAAPPCEADTNSPSKDNPTNMTSASDPSLHTSSKEFAQTLEKPLAEQHTDAEADEVPSTAPPSSSSTASPVKKKELTSATNVDKVSDEKSRDSTQARPSEDGGAMPVQDAQKSDGSISAEADAKSTHKEGEKEDLTGAKKAEDGEVSDARSENPQEDSKDSKAPTSPLEEALAAIEKAHKNLETRLQEADPSDAKTKDVLTLALGSVTTALDKVKEVQSASAKKDAAEKTAKALQMRAAAAQARIRAAVGSTSANTPLSEQQKLRQQATLNARQQAVLSALSQGDLASVRQALAQVKATGTAAGPNQQPKQATSSSAATRTSQPPAYSRNVFSNWRAHCAGLDVPPGIVGMLDSAANILSNARTAFEPKRELQLLQSKDFAEWNKRNAAACGGRAALYLSDAPVQRPKVSPAVAKAAMAASSDASVNFDLAKHRSLRNASDPGKRSYLLLPVNKGPGAGLGQMPAAGPAPVTMNNDPNQPPMSGQRPLPTMMRLVIDKSVRKELPPAERGRKWSTQEIREHRL